MSETDKEEDDQPKNKRRAREFVKEAEQRHKQRKTNELESRPVF